METKYRRIALVVAILLVAAAIFYAVAKHPWMCAGAVVVLYLLACAVEAVRLHRKGFAWRDAARLSPAWPLEFVKDR